jgi:recombination protein RecT
MTNQKPELSNYDQIKKWLEAISMREIFQQSLPKSVPVDNWINTALSTIRTSEEIQNAEPLSTLGALMTIASLGLRLEGPLGQAYLTTRNVKKKNKQSGQWEWSHKETQMQVGYRGLLAIAWRDPEVQDIEAIIVRKNDEFDFQRGSNSYLTHKWEFGVERGPIVAVYSGLRFKNGYYSFEPYDIESIMDLRSDILKQNGISIEQLEKGGVVYHKKKWGDSGTRQMSEDEASKVPWIGHLDPMIKKTVIRRSANYWKLGNDFETAANLVAIDEAGLSQNLARAASDVMPQEINPNNQNKPMNVRSRKKNSDIKARLVAEADASRSAADSKSSKEVDKKETSMPETKKAKSNE